MTSHDQDIYVEIQIQSGLDELRKYTHTPEFRRQWDLRFSSIEDLPCLDDCEPKKFLYSTHFGFGIHINGTGEMIEDLSANNGHRRTELKYSSEDSKSLIREGEGFWELIPHNKSVRFLTRYRYLPRFGTLGKAIDRLFMRPWLRWATAWSFDRLRLWLEKGIHPSVSMQRFFIHTLSRCTVGFVWLYQGLIPKLIFPDTDEYILLLDSNFSADFSTALIHLLGSLEILLGLVILIAWRWILPLRLTVYLMIAGLINTALHSPDFLTAAFNPVSLNLTLVTLSLIALNTRHDLPSASHCRYQPEVSDENS